MERNVWWSHFAFAFVRSGCMTWEGDRSLLVGGGPYIVPKAENLKAKQFRAQNYRNGFGRSPSNCQYYDPKFFA